MSVHADTVEIYFLVDQLSTSADTRNATTSALGSLEKIKKQQRGDCEDDVEKYEMQAICIVVVSEVHPIGARENVWEFPPLAVRTTVVEALQRIEEAIREIADYPRSEETLKTKYADFAAAEEDWKQKMASCE